MPHQAQVVASAKNGHRTFLLADEPGLGKTAQALLAAQAAHAHPLLVVVPNVVKTSWAREAAMWTPKHGATVIHGDGETVDAFCDIVIVNYDILDRHVGWLGSFGFRGMVIDEAHFIKNKSSQRSKNVLDLSRRIRERTTRPLLMALTGTPLINDIEDFLAIWEFLGWITGAEVGLDLLHALEANALTPLDPGFYPAARESVIEMGVVRRRKVDVAKDIPDRRIADVPVELEGAAGSSVRAAERKLVQRLVKRYRSAVAARKDADEIVGVDESIVRQVCARELRNSDENSTGENIFSMMRRIGQAKAELAADYTAQLSRNAGKVVFFAKHIDVMDAAERVFAKRGIGYSSIRGDQTTRVRQTQHRRVRQRRGRARRRLLADCRRRRHQPSGVLQRRARRAVMDRCRADPGDRSGPPDRSGPAGHCVAGHRHADRRRAGCRAHQRQGGLWPRAHSTAPTSRSRASTSSSRRWSAC